MATRGLCTGIVAVTGNEFLEPCINPVIDGLIDSVHVNMYDSACAELSPTCLPTRLNSTQLAVGLSWVESRYVGRHEFGFRLVCRKPSKVAAK